MATLTLKPGPHLLYLAEYDKSILTDLDRYDELPNEIVITPVAHEYLFETLRQFDSPCLSDFVLLADGNPYLLGIYMRNNAVQLVTEALRLRALPEARPNGAQHVRLSQNQLGDLDLCVVMMADVDGRAEWRDACDVPFADVYTLPVLFEPFAKSAQIGDQLSLPALPPTVLEPTLGELLRLVFSRFEVDVADRDNHVEWAGTEDDDENVTDDRRLAAYDSESDAIAAEIESDRDDWARSEDSGWYYEE